MRSKAVTEPGAILEHLDKVRITRTNAVSEVVRYATIGASLLADLTFVLLYNDSDVSLIASDNVESRDPPSKPRAPLDHLS